MCYNAEAGRENRRAAGEEWNVRIELGYGAGTQAATIPDTYNAALLLPREGGASADEETLLRNALENPLGAPRLRDIARPGEKVAVVTSDITRPVPSARILPFVLDELYAAGVSPADITVVFGLGTHRAQTEEERRRLAGERAAREVRLMDSDPDNCVRLGFTHRGTPVDVFRAVAEADRRVCLGNVEFHWFAGYSGGGKAIMPGVSSREAVRHNHSLMASPDACAGRLEGNPLREDIEEAAAICGVDFIVNVVLDAHKRIVGAAAGDAVAAHRAACRALDQLYAAPIDALADVVIVSQGGAPKDINLYQLQKALDNARHAVKPGGTVVLVGRCAEGFGEKTFEQWMKEARSPEALVERIGREFRIGGHKAAAYAQAILRAEIVLVSELPDDVVRSIFMRPAADLQAAVDYALAKAGPSARVLVMPYGGSTLPLLRKEQAE